MMTWKNAFQKIITYASFYALTLFIILSALSSPSSEQNGFFILRAVIIFFATILLSKYFFYMLVSPWFDIAKALHDRQFTQTNTNYYPKVSVIIPCWNEEIGILTTVQSLLASTYRNLEIVIVNDGSTDNSHAVIRRFIRKYRRRKKSDISLVYRYKENGGKGHALNTGLSLATGDILLSIDADCFVSQTAIGNFVNCFTDPSVMAAVGNVKIGNTQSLIGTLQALEFLFSFYFKKADSILNTIYIIGGAAGAFRREVFEKLGPYNTQNITEDIELSVRIQECGMKIVYAADAIIYTEGASDIRGLKRQRLRWKRGRIETFQDHKKLFFSCARHHNKLLTWIVLPLAIFGDIQLFFELIFLGFLYIHSYLTNDFSSFVSGVVVVGSMFFVQMFFEGKESRKFSFLLLAPIGWLLFYIASYVEYTALLKAFWGILRGHECRWQKWQRTGVGVVNQKQLHHSI
jgi:poly-beta-1,6-N-acetyl-D-glucosamine synthase